MSTEIEQHYYAATDSWIPVLAQVGDLAQKIGGTDFVPKGLRGKPADVAACVLFGRELRLEPMQALQHVYVVNGRPQLSATAMRALIQRAGHRVRVIEWSDTKCTLAGMRADDEYEHRVTYSMADAQRAGLAGKDVWRQYPRNMLLARATSELARAAFPDILMGVDVWEEHDLPQQQTGGRQRVAAPRREQPAAIPPAVGADEPSDNQSSQSTAPAQSPSQPEQSPAATVHDHTAKVRKPTKPQMRKLMAELADRGLTDERHEWASSVLNRVVESFSELTRDDYRELMESLDSPPNDAPSVPQPPEQAVDEAGTPPEPAAAPPAPAPRVRPAPKALKNALIRLCQEQSIDVADALTAVNAGSIDSLTYSECDRALAWLRGDKPEQEVDPNQGELL